MSSHSRRPSHSGSGSGSAPPKRIRTALACINCRRRKRKCLTAEGSNICTRCQMQNLVCEFPAPDADELALAAHLELQGSYSSNSYPYASNSYSQSHSYSPGPGQTRPGSTAPLPPLAASAYTVPSNYGQGHGSGAALPYTGPPPPHTRPRYSNGTPYPNLALAAEADHQQSGVAPGQQGGYPAYTGADYTAAANPYNPYQQR
ncbi:hypothetical protein C8F01DRAFT_1375695 [Mycena amicta]|nr:hypothetical protein C8F01DRAFT_1375695 [Mycena amicta]